MSGMKTKAKKSLWTTLKSKISPPQSKVYDKAVQSLNGSDYYEFSGESEYSRDRSDPYQMVDYMIDRNINFRGFGPKGFTISDDQIREEVCEVLTRDSFIDASEIDVEVNNGCVILKGHVDSRQTKSLAELTTEGLNGVHDVVNLLKFDGELRVEHS
jgi:osmotically-inducible protein OsmY